MKRFEYSAPRDVEEAISLLGDEWGKTEILAGGMDLVTSLKQGITSPDRLVSLKRISQLKGIEVERNQIRIGATTTLADLAAHEAVQKHFPSLVTAVDGIGSPQMISFGTVGGDLCQRPRCWYFRNGYGLFGTRNGTSLVREGDNRYHAIFATDNPALFVNPSSLAPGLMALDAVAVIQGPEKKTREVSLREFFRIPRREEERETVLRPREILTEIRVPLNGLKNATYEVRHRGALDWPYVTASVAFKVNGGRASDARVVLGHVAAMPWRVPNAARVLEGRIDSELAARCGAASIEAAKPLNKNGYKVPLVKTAVKRAALAAAGA